MTLPTPDMELSEELVRKFDKDVYKRQAVGLLS